MLAKDIALNYIHCNNTLPQVFLTYFIKAKLKKMCLNPQGLLYD